MGFRLPRLHAPTGWGSSARLEEPFFPSLPGSPERLTGRVPLVPFLGAAGADRVLGSSRGRRHHTLRARHVGPGRLPPLPKGTDRMRGPSLAVVALDFSPGLGSRRPPVRRRRESPAPPLFLDAYSRHEP